MPFIAATEELRSTQLSRLLSWNAAGLSGIGVLASEPTKWETQWWIGALVMLGGIGGAVIATLKPPSHPHAGKDRAAAWLATALAALTIGSTAWNQDWYLVGASFIWTLFALVGAAAAYRTPSDPAPLSPTDVQTPDHRAELPPADEPDAEAHL